MLHATEPLATKPRPSFLASMPRPLLHLVLTYLPSRDLTAMASTSKKMQFRTVQEIANDERILGLHLLSFCKRCNIPIQEDIPCLHKFANLQELHSYIWKMSPLIQTTVQKIPSEKIRLSLLRGLQEKCAPFSALKKLVEQEIELAKAKDLPASNHKDKLLHNIALSYIKQHSFAKAFEIAGSVTDIMLKGRILAYIFHTLLKNADCSQAIAIASSITNEIPQGWAIWGAALILAKAREYEQSILFASAITDPSSKAAAFQNIPTIVAQHASIKQVEKIIRLIPDHHCQEKSLQQITLSWLERKFPDKALQTAQLMRDKDVQQNFFIKIFFAFLQTNQQAKALQMGPLLKETTGTDLFEILIERDEPHEARLLALQIPHEPTKHYTLWNIVKLLAKNGNIYQAQETANSIPHESIKSWALASICQTLLDSRKIDQAFDMIKYIPNEGVKNMVRLEIAKMLAEENQFAAASLIAKTISEKQSQHRCLQLIHTSAR